MAEEETTLTTEEQQRTQRMLQALLGDDFDPNESLRSQTRKLLEEQNIRNAASIAAQAADITLTDYIRLFYLQSQFEDPAAAPGVIQFEMMDLRSKLHIQTNEPAAEYTGPTSDITSGPAAVTGEDLAKAYVAKHGEQLPDGPLDHSDTVVTKADLEDAIKKYESIEITPEQIAAYKQDSLQKLIDSRMDGVDPSDPDYASKLERATTWAHEMGLPSESVVTAALRAQTFTEQYPEMRMSDEQAKIFAQSYGVDADAVQNVGSVLSFYTDTAAATDLGMHSYVRERDGLLADLQQQRATEYQNRISTGVAEVKGIADNVGGLAFTAMGDSESGIDRDAFKARQDEMNAAFESGDYNTAMNIGNQLTATVLADADARQLKVLTDNFDDLKASAEGAGYTVETPEDLQALLNGEDGAQVKQDMMGQRWADGTNAQNVFLSGEYTAAERLHNDALTTKSEINTAAAKFDGIDLTEPDTAELTTKGVMAAESAAAPQLDLRDAATKLINEYRDTGGARIGPLLKTATGDGVEFDRVQNTMEMLPDFNAGVKFDLDNPEGLTAALATIETYKTGEIPTPERMRQIEGIVDAAFNDENAVTLDAANAGASIHAQFNQMAANAPSFLSRVFGNNVEVGIPDGYDARVANVPTTPEEQTPTVTTGLAM